MQNNSNDPSFTALQNGLDGHTQLRISLRDWFAGMAIGAPCIKNAKVDCVKDFENVAADCYAIADAMIEARKKFG